MPYNEILENFSLIVLAIVFGAQVIGYFKIKIRAFFDWLVKFSWPFSLVVVFGYEFYLVILQYIYWSGSPFTQVFLSPYYFLTYVTRMLVGQSVIAFLAAILFWQAAKFLNKRSSERFFEKEELEIFRLAIFLTGYPAFLIYFIVLILAFLIFNLALSIYHIIAEKASLSGLPRFPLYFFWLPTAIFAIIIKSWLDSKGILLFFNL